MALPPRPKTDAARPPAPSPTTKAVKKPTAAASKTPAPAKGTSAAPKPQARSVSPAKLGSPLASSMASKAKPKAGATPSTSSAPKKSTSASSATKKPAGSSSARPRSSTPGAPGQGIPDAQQPNDPTQQQGQPQAGHPTHAVNISVQTGASPHAGMASAGQVSAQHGAPAMPQGDPSQPPPTQTGQPGAAPAPNGGNTSTKPKTGVSDLAKGPSKESTPPKDVQAARKTQSTVLKARQQKEIRGKNQGPVRDKDPGAGSWPPLSPML